MINFTIRIKYYLITKMNHYYITIINFNLNFKIIYAYFNFNSDNAILHHFHPHQNRIFLLLHFHFLHDLDYI